MVNTREHRWQQTPENFLFSHAAVSDKRIVACDESRVTFRYTPSGERRSRTRSVEGTEFVRGFVQHTLPSRFQKVRHYGWMSSNSRIQMDELGWLIWLFRGWTYWLANRSSEPESKPQHPRCSKCGGSLRLVMITDPYGRVLYQHALPYLDSG